MLNHNGSQSSSQSKVLLVTTAAQTKHIVSLIKQAGMNDPSTDIVLGLDCEGLNRNQPLSLLQVNRLEANISHKFSQFH